MNIEREIQKKKIPVGVDNFHRLITEDYLFCDKSLLIQEYIDKGEIVTLITRPRRWGKTLNMSMLHHFFAEEVYGNKTKGLFDNLAIASVKNGEYLKYQGQYPVIFISFKDVKESSFEDAITKIRLLIRTLYRGYRYLSESEQLVEDEKTLLISYLEGTVENTELEDALRYLSELLYKHHNKKVYILIDEYDTPLNSAYGKYLEPMTSFMRNMFSAALKGNEALEKGIMTGILRVSKDSMLSGLNNLMVYTLLDSSYKIHFGFSEAEVIYLFSEQKCALALDEVKQWYNGYKAYDLVIYNPWSIIACLSRGGEIDLYWTETARNDLIKSTITDSNAEVKFKLEKLMQGESIISGINKNVTFDILKNNEIALWSLLLFTGYLKAEASRFDLEQGTHITELRIPNREIFMLYKNYVMDWFAHKLYRGEDGYHSMLDTLVKGEVEKFTENLKNYLLETASYFDVREDQKGESFYHGFSLALVAGLWGKYHIRSNRESGLGRYDVLLIPKAQDRSQGIVLEFKYINSDEKGPLLAEMALKQINDNLYVTEFKSYHYVKSVLKIGIAFSGKSVFSTYEVTEI